MKLPDVHDYIIIVAVIIIVIITDGRLVIIKAIRIPPPSKTKIVSCCHLGTVFEGHTHVFCTAISAPAVEPIDL